MLYSNWLLPKPKKKLIITNAVPLTEQQQLEKK